MIPKVNDTHNPGIRSWLASANTAGTDFPIQNLPYGVFHKKNSDGTRCVGVAIGDHVLDLRACADFGLLDKVDPEVRSACTSTTLSALMALGNEAQSVLRNRLFEMLIDSSRETETVRRALVPMAEAVMHLPAAIGDYTDFYASIHHATNVGSMFRPDNPLLPNYKYVPIGYHGRSSSIVVSGNTVKRPSGQLKEEKVDQPSFKPSQRLDYELEVGVFVGKGNALGSPVGIDVAYEHLFGICLLNDWSARDIQTWEYQPLGPFLAKNFCSTISPWVVTMEALAPFRVPAFVRPASDPDPLPYLSSDDEGDRGGIDLTLEVYLRSQKMKDAGMRPHLLSRGNFREMYWTFGQMLAHHASNGCNLRPGDLLGSGTVSGPEQNSVGSLLELAWRGTRPVLLPTGEERKFLQDGDEITMRGYCAASGFVRIGLGECVGTIVPAAV
jgi:fumarylacetoacetase